MATTLPGRQARRAAAARRGEGGGGTGAGAPALCVCLLLVHGARATPTLCGDGCVFARDGSCDDGGVNSKWGDCALGSDCTDCGARATVGVLGECEYASAKPNKLDSSRPESQPGGQLAAPPSAPARAITNLFAVVANGSKWLTTEEELGQVVGGVDVTRGEYSFLASLQSYDRADGSGYSYCGAVLIGQRWALTAAHCTVSGVRSTIAVGGHDLRAQVSGGDACVQRVRRYRVHGHPEYNPRNQHNDIALLEFLDRSVTYEPVLHVTDATDGEWSTVMGWGRTTRDDAPSATPVPKKIGVRVRSQQACRASYAFASPAWTIEETMVCAGGTGEFTGSCNGDSGGPLIVDQTRTVRPGHGLLGLVSFAIRPCADDDIPTVFTRVARYTPWICAIACGEAADACPPLCRDAEPALVRAELVCTPCSFAKTAGELRAALRAYLGAASNVTVYLSEANAVRGDALGDADELRGDATDGVLVRLEYVDERHSDVAAFLREHGDWSGAGAWAQVADQRAYPPASPPLPFSPPREQTSGLWRILLHVATWGGCAIALACWLRGRSEKCHHCWHFSGF